MGMIHRRHLSSKRYSIEVVKRLIRAFHPDIILAEIPPDRLDTALSQFRRSGRVDEPRVASFPEYTQAVFPLTAEMNYTIVACAAWTKEMAADRRAKLEEWKRTRPDDSAEVAAGREWMNKELARAGLGADPAHIHTRRYDRIIARGLEPYDRLFNDDLGPGGWSNINAAHYALIEAALDRYRGRGVRILITFGAWHKHYILDQLRKRDDIVVRNILQYTD